MGKKREEIEENSETRSPAADTKGGGRNPQGRRRLVLQGGGDCGTGRRRLPAALSQGRGGTRLGLANLLGAAVSLLHANEPVSRPAACTGWPTAQALDARGC
jgi:hypothetical protein